MARWPGESLRPSTHSEHVRNAALELRQQHVAAAESAATAAVLGGQGQPLQLTRGEAAAKSKSRGGYGKALERGACRRGQQQQNYCMAPY